MTEEEAKQKWCPMARVITVNGRGATFNRSPDDVSNGVGGCIGSACMMWREHLGYGEGSIAGNPVYVVKGGYCGLAGKL